LWDKPNQQQKQQNTSSGLENVEEF